MGSTVALVTPILPTFAAATGIGLVTSSAAVETHTLSNQHTFSAGSGLSLVKTGEAHQHSNSAPVPMLNAGGVCHMPGTMSELILANSTGTLTSGALTVTPQVGGAVTITGQSGIT